MMLLAGLTAAANGCDFGEPFWRRLEAMLDFIASCMDVAGHVPALGDADDAVIVRFNPERDLRVYQSLLATGSVLFDRGDFKHKAQVFDDKSRWLLGDAAAAKFAALVADSSGERLRRCFEAGGYYILGSDFETPREVRLIVDAAPLGYLAIAAHGHADALAFTLSVCGRPMLIDPGTYSYHTHRAGAITFGVRRRITPWSSTIWTSRSRAVPFSGAATPAPAACYSLPVPSRSGSSRSTTVTAVCATRWCIGARFSTSVPRGS